MGTLFIGCTDDDDCSPNIILITLKVTDETENALTLLLAGSNAEARISAIAHYDSKTESKLNPKYISIEGNKSIYTKYTSGKNLFIKAASNTKSNKTPMIMATYNGVTSGIISFMIKAKDDTQSNPNTPDNSNGFDKTDTQIFLMHPTSMINQICQMRKINPLKVK